MAIVAFDNFKVYVTHLPLVSFLREPTTKGELKCEKGGWYTGTSPEAFIAAENSFYIKGD